MTSSTDDYDVLNPHRSLLAFAIVCGLTPLIVGVGIFITWCVTQSAGLQLLGLFNILGGCFAFLCGVVAVAMYFHRSLRDLRQAGPAIVWSVLTFCLLVLNFPVCMAILSSVSQIERGARTDQFLQRPAVHVVNASGLRVTKLTVKGAGAGPVTLSEDGATTLSVDPSDGQELKMNALLGEKRLEFAFSLPRQQRAAWAGSVIVVLLPDGTARAHRIWSPQNDVD